MGDKRKVRDGSKALEGMGQVVGKSWTVLPCNGLDKEAGALAREVALALSAEGCSLICPVLYGRDPSRYRRELEGDPLLVIDGCKRGCASKLARENGLKIARRLNVRELLREVGIKSGKSPVPDPAHLSRLLSLLQSPEPEKEEYGEAAARGDLFTGTVEYREFMLDKFVFKVPTTGYFFNENDCWARVEEGRARLGVSDYVQQNVSDIVFFEPPRIGTEINIFDEAGSLESVKTVFDIISPVSGIVVAVNRELVDAPELINEDPYVAGWAVEVDLTDFAGDRELLMDCERYFSHLEDSARREFEKRYDT